MFHLGLAKSVREKSTNKKQRVGNVRANKSSPLGDITNGTFSMTFYYNIIISMLWFVFS